MLNGIQGQDASHFGSGIRTEAGYSLYLEILADLKGGSAKKRVSNKAIATEWNKRARAKLTAAGEGRAKLKEIKEEYGFPTAANARAHESRQHNG